MFYHHDHHCLFIYHKKNYVPVQISVSYHEFKEKPGLLQSALPHAPTAHHPLQGQLFMEELSMKIERETKRGGWREKEGGNRKQYSQTEIM